LFGCAAPALGALAWRRIDSATQREARGAAPPPTASLEALERLASFPKQGPNECGAYSAAVALELSGLPAPSPRAMVAEISDLFAASEALSGTRPWRLCEALSQRGFRAEGAAADHLEGDARLDLLRSEIAAQRPVIALVESDRGAEHYVVVVGYRPGQVDLYDPNVAADPSRPGVTGDLNGALPGNRSESSARFAARWGRGGMLGLYRFWYLPLRPAGAPRGAPAKSG
jgi:hypothetical protein